MNSIKNFLNITLSVIAFFYSTSLFATTFNPLSNTELSNWNSQNALLTAEGRFIFFRQNDNQSSSIISLNLADMVFTELMTFDDSRISTGGSEMVQLDNGQVLLVALVSNNSSPFNDKQLFKSDGVTPFEAITTANLTPNLSSVSQINGYYFIGRSDNALVWTNGHETFEHLFPDNVVPLCVFESRKILFASQSRINWDLMLFDDGNLNLVQPK